MCSNLVAPVGHRIAQAIYRAFGFASLVLQLGLGMFAWKLFRDEPRRLTLAASAAHASRRARR